MIDQLAALRALQEAGTTGRAATRLRLSQSAVSKRIAALEARVGAPLLERDGRRVRLTPAARRLLDEALPLVRALEETVTRLDAGGPPRVRVAATESLLAAWLPARLRAAAEGVELELHAHRGPVALDRLRAGEVDVAVVVGAVEEGLVGQVVAREPMGVVWDGPLPAEAVRVWTVEAGSLTGGWIARRLARQRGPRRVEVVGRIESFGALVALARAGFAPALVPEGIARAMGVPDAAWTPLHGWARPVVACARPSGWERAAVRGLVRRLGRPAGAGGALAAVTAGPGSR